jgi:hypothetical protein
MTTRDWMRLGLLLLGIPQAAIGLWAIADPTAWFDTFPGAGHNWLPEFGPYNEHLAVDAGAGLFAAGVVANAAAVMLERRVVQIAMVAFLAWSVPHALWHLTALDEALAGGDDIANVFALAFTVVLPIVLLATANRLEKTA